jgi:predicted transcriptional regulator
VSDLDLLLRIRGDSKEAQKALSEVKGALGETFESPQAVLKALGDRILGSLVSPLGLVATGGAVVIGTIVGLGKTLYEMAEKAARAGAELGDVSEITGIAIEPLSALRGAVQLAGGDVGGFTNALVKMRKGVADGSADLERGLKNLGISVTAFRDLKPDEQVLALSKGFRGLPEDANKAAIAMDVFGRSGAEMIPLLDKPLEQLIQRARDLGMVWSTDDVRAAEQFEMSSRQLDVMLESIESRIGRALLPTLANLLTSIVNNKALMDDLAAAGKGLALVLGLLVEWGGKWATSSLLASARSSLFAAAIDGLKILVLDAIATVLTALMKVPGASAVLGESLAYITSETIKARASAELHTKAAEAQTRAAIDVAVVTQAAGKALQSLGTDTKGATGAADDHTGASARLTIAQRAQQAATEALGEAHKQLDPAVQKATQQMLAAGFSAGEIIKRFKDAQIITEADTAAIQRLEDAHKAAVTKTKEHQDAIEKINKAEVTLTAAQADGVRMLAERGIAESDIAKALNVSEVAVKKIVDAQKLYKDSLQKLDDQSRQFVADQIKRMETDSKGVVDNLKIQIDARKQADDLIAQRVLSSFEYQKRQIADWAADAKLKVDGTKNNAAAAYKDIDRVATEKLNDATKAWLYHGEQTKGELRRQAAEAKARYAEILTSADATTTAITQAWQEMVDANDKANEGLGASFNKAMKSLPAMVVSSLTGGGGITGALKGVASQVGSDFGAKLFGPTGALKGIGDAIPGIGPAIGALLGPLMTKLAGLFSKPEYKKIMQDVGTSYGVSLSEGLAKEIADMEKKFKISRTIAEQISLDKIIGEQGGITSANLQKWEQQAMPLFDVIKKGGAAGAAATQTLTKLLGDFATQTEKNGGIWDATFTQMIAKAKELGVATSDITALLQAQQDKIGTATANVVKGLTDTAAAAAETQTAIALKALGDVEANDPRRLAIIAGVNAGIRGNYQEEFDRVSRITLNSFNTLIASGKSSAEAVALVGPAIDALIASAAKLGFTGNAAFDELSRWRQLTVLNKPLLDQVSGLNDLLVATANLGGLTADSFADLEAQGVDAFTQLTAAGFTQQEAEQAMKPMLENIIRLHKERGFAIDDETQKIIDQATADGVLGAQAMSTNDILMTGFAAIIKAVGGELPAAFKKFADGAQENLKELPHIAQKAAAGIQEALNAITDPTVTVRYRVAKEGEEGGAGAGTEEVPAFPNRPLEMVRRAGLAMVHPGDVVGVPTPTTMQRIAALSGGAGGIGGSGVRDIHVNVTPQLAIFQDYQAMKDLAAVIREEILIGLVSTTPVVPVI